MVVAMAHDVFTGRGPAAVRHVILQVAVFACAVILAAMAQPPVATDFDSLWDYDDPAASEARFRELLPTITGPQRSLQLQTQIARALGLQRKFDEAHRMLDRVEHAAPLPPLTEVRYLLERGRVFNSSGSPDKARPLFRQAWDKARSATLDFFAVDAAHMIAIVEPPDSALEWNAKAIAVAEASADPNAKNWLGSLYNNVGWTWYDKAEYAKALDYFQRDLAWFVERNREPQARIARYSIGKTWRAMGRLDDALKMQEEIRREIEDRKLKPDGYVFEEIAECLHALGRHTEAKKYFARAYDLLSRDEWLASAEPKRLERLRQLAQVQP
jgi:tetratricopeptide (TPR) repeat protein